MHMKLIPNFAIEILISANWISRMQSNYKLIDAKLTTTRWINYYWPLFGSYFELTLPLTIISILLFNLSHPLISLTLRRNPSMSSLPESEVYSNSRSFKGSCLSLICEHGSSTCSSCEAGKLAGCNTEGGIEHTSDKTLAASQVPPAGLSCTLKARRTSSLRGFSPRRLAKLKLFKTNSVSSKI